MIRVLASLLGGSFNPFEKDAQVKMGEFLPQIMVNIKDI